MNITMIGRFSLLIILLRIYSCELMASDLHPLSHDGSFCRPQGVTVSCKTCSLEGEIEITKGTFQVSDSNDLSDMSETIAFLDHGSIEIVAKELAAVVELGLDFVLSQPLISLNMTLPTIPLTPFEVGLLTI